MLCLMVVVSFVCNSTLCVMDENVQRSKLLDKEYVVIRCEDKQMVAVKQKALRKIVHTGTAAGGIVGGVTGIIGGALYGSSQSRLKEFPDVPCGMIVGGLLFGFFGALFGETLGRVIGQDFILESDQVDVVVKNDAVKEAMNKEM
jgi:hypothetical protein